ncbi:MAG: acyl-ACP--UDP-N-acetylglucosamine O-acyltransferase [Bacteroidota bacterium]
MRNLEFWHKNPIVGEPFVSLGDRVTIGSGSEIMGGVQIGNDSWIGSNVTMYDGARIGRSCRIFPGAVISAIPQDLKFKGEKTTVEVGDFTTIRECVTLNRGTEALGKTVIGSQVLIMAYAHVAHDCIVGNQVVLANAVTMAGHVEVGDFTIIGGVSAIHQFVKIGRHVMISGGSLIRKDIPPFVKAGRNPLTYEGVNSIGLRRRGFSNDTIHHIQEFYRLLYLSGMNTSQAVAYIEAHLPATEERDEAITFVRNASRGIIRSNNNLPKSNPPTDPPQ